MATDKGLITTVLKGTSYVMACSTNSEFVIAELLFFINMLTGGFKKGIT
jgi:hypothetical protein